MSGHIAGTLTHHWQVICTAHFEHLVSLPLVVLPRVDTASKFTEVDLWIEVGSKPMAMLTGVDIDDINRLQSIEIFIFS